MPRARLLLDSAVTILRAQPDAPRSQYAHALKVSTYGRNDVATMEEVLAINREIYGDVHPVVAASLSDLALTVEATDPARAESLLSEALRIDEALLGEGHPTTRIILNNLAALKRDRGDLEGAVPLYRRGLELLHEHEPDSRRSLGFITYGLGVSLHGLGRHAEAEPHLPANEGALVLEELAELYTAQGRNRDRARIERDLEVLAATID